MGKVGTWIDAARFRASMSRRRDLCSAWEASESEVRERYSTVVLLAVLLAVGADIDMAVDVGRMGDGDYRLPMDINCTGGGTGHSH